MRQGGQRRFFVAVAVATATAVGVAALPAPTAAAAGRAGSVRPAVAPTIDVPTRLQVSGRLDSGSRPDAFAAEAAPGAAAPSPVSFAVPELTPADASDFPGGAENNEISYPMVTSGAMNGDDIPDLVAAYYPGCCNAVGGVAVMLGLGDGTFGEPSPVPISGTGNTRVMGLGLGDFDEDGDLDVFGTVPQRSEIDLWLNDGSGALSAPTFTPLTTRPGDDVKVADLDDDDHLDVVAGGTDGSVTVFYGRGDGTFADVVLATAPGAIAAVVVGDFDGEGALDIAWGGHFTRTVTVATATAARAYATSTVAIPFVTASHLFAADLDGDEVLDLGMGGFNATENPPVSRCFSCVGTLHGNGDGTFAPPPVAEPSSWALVPDNLFQSGNTGDPWGPSSPDPVDVDGDGDIDLVFAFPSHEGMVVIARNDGGGDYEIDMYVAIADNSGTRVGAYQINADFTNGTGQFVRGVAIDDFDADGSIDLAVAGEEGGAFTANRGEIQIVRGDPERPGDFLAPKVSAFAERGGLIRSGIAFADWDGDGDDDVIAMRYDNNRAVMFENVDGDLQDAVDIQGGLRGTFSCNRTNWEQWLDSGDFDGDGHDDVLCRGANAAGVMTLSVWFGDGANGADLVDIASYGGSFSMPWLHLADIDGDGDDDILDSRITACGPCQMSTVPYRNNGDRTFDELPSVLHGNVDQFQTPVVPVDVDNDDDLDLVARPGTGTNPPLQVRRNDGTGAFGDPTSSQPVALGNRNLAVHTLLAGDLDKDGNRDIVIQKSWDYQSNIGAIWPGGLFVMTGNGDGTFDDPVAYVWGGGGGANEGLVDMDRDGYLDLPVNATHWGSEVLRNAGDGTFEPTRRFYNGTQWGYAMRVRDLDGDGRPEIVKVRHDMFALSVLRNTSTGTVAGPNLTVGPVEAPEAVVPGANGTVRATVTNTGTRASGTWTDQVWLSADDVIDANDRLLGSVDHTGLAGGGSYTLEVRAPFAPIVDGTHRVLVRVDARARVAETDEGDNRAAHAGTEIAIPALVEGSPLDVALDDQLGYARVEAAAGEQIIVRADASVTIDAVRGKVPVPARDLVARDEPLVIPAHSDSATWYLQIAPGDGVESVTLERAPLDFGIVAVEPGVIGNTGSSTVTILGDGFTDDSQVTLVLGDDEITASEVTRVDARRLLAKFAFTRGAVDTGRYDVRVDDGDDTATLAAALNVVDDDDAGTLEIDVSSPGTVRSLGIERGVPFTVTFRNNGVNDIPAAYLFAESPGVLWDDPRVEGLDFATPSMDIVTELLDGPVGVLPPGGVGRVELKYQPTAASWSIDLGALEADASDVSSDFLDELLPSLGGLLASSPVAARLLNDFDATSGDGCPCVSTGAYVRALNAAAREGFGHGLTLGDADARFEYIVERALATTNGAPLGGTVVDADGEPVARVDVDASTATGESRVARTWFDGQFRIWDPVAGVHQLRVDGFLPDPARSVTVGSAAARDVELEVGLGSAVVGRVTRADGAPVEGATVAIYHGDGAFALVTTDAGGRVERAGLHAGPAIVVVSAPGLVPVRSVVELGAAPLDISSTLELGSTVTGTVRGPDGQPLSGAEVKVEIDPELPAPARVATDGAGRYAIAGVPAGAWGLEVAAEGLATRQVSFVADGSAPTTVDVGLTTGGSLTGQVTRRDTGGPFAEASVWVVSELGPPREITTDASGRYAVTDLAPGGAVLTISDPDAVYLPEQHEWTVEDGVETTFDAALGLPSVVRGRVRDAEGRDVAGVSVSWDSMAGPASTLTDADGEYELVGVAPGPVQIDVGGGVVRRPVSVPGDGAEVVADVVVDARRVSGRLLDGDGSPAPNALVGVFVGDAFVATAKSESDGTFTALIFEPGTYELRAGADGFGTARTTVVVGDADVVVGDVEAGSSSLAIEVTVDGDVPSGEVGASLAATGSPLQYAGDAEDDQVTFSDLEVGVYTAVVFGEGGATRQVEIQIEPGGNEVTIDLDPAVAVVGRVEVGGDGAELASVFASGVANGTAAFALTSAGGDFVLDGLAPGATRVSAFDVDGRNVGSALVDVGAGGAIIEIDLAPAPLADVRVVADGDAVVNAAIAARDAGPIPGPSRFTEGDGRATVALPAAGPVTMVAAAPGRPVVELSVDDPGEAEVVVDVGPTIAVGLQAPEVSTLGVKSRSKSPTVRDLSDTGFGELVAWISRHASPVAWVGYFTYNEGLEPQRNEALEESVDANLKALLRLNVQPGREFCPGFTESLNEVENLRRQVEVAYSGWVSAQDAFDIAWDDAKVRLPLGLAKIVASLGLMLVSAPLLAGATTLTLEIVAGAGLALGLLDAFVSIVTGALDAIPGAFTYEGFLSWLNNMKDAISAGGTQAAAALSVWIEGLKAIAKNPKGAAYLAYSELVTGMKLLPAGVTKLQHWTMKSVTWLNQKVPIAELGAKVLGYAAALLDFVSLAQAHAESVRLVQGADDARAVGQRNYNELLRRLFAETRRALALGSKDCKKDPKFVLRRKRNLQGSFYVPSDPNDIVGPAGPGAAHWLAADPIGLEYTINFENLGPGSLVIPPGREPAKIAAALVDVTMPIDTDLDIDSFELGDIGWADIEVDVPEGRQSWSARLGPYEDLGGIFVDVSGEVDRSTRTVRWIFKAIDPETGDTPIDERGFLVPENGEGDGQGWIRFRADAVDGLANGTRISQQASIVFDTEDPLATNVWTNRIDTAAPKVTMRALRPTTDKTIELAWIGVDTGSGAASYDVYVAVDGGPLKLWKSDVTARSAVYRGAVGSRYGFAVRATDRVGYVGVKPRTAQTTTRVVADTGGSGGSSGGLSGFVAVGADRAVYAEGGASFHGSLAGQAMTSPVVSIARTPTGKGYWILTREGQVYTFGDARFHGTTRASYAAVRVRTNAPAVAIMGTPTGRGYWIVTRDGGVFSFGDARFHGSLGGVRLAEPIVAAQATATGRGYWLVGEDGGVFTFGDAAFRGSPGGRRLDGDVVGFDVTGGGSGYVLITERGTLHAFGKATRATASGGGAAVGIVAAPKGGYWVIGADGGVRSVAGAGAVRDLRPLVHARILATS